MKVKPSSAEAHRRPTAVSLCTSLSPRHSPTLFCLSEHSSVTSLNLFQCLRGSDVSLHTHNLRVLWTSSSCSQSPNLQPFDPDSGSWGLSSEIVAMSTLTFTSLVKPSIKRAKTFDSWCVGDRNLPAGSRNWEIKKHIFHVFKSRKKICWFKIE